MDNYFSNKIESLIIGQFKSSTLLISFIKAMSSEADFLKDEVENVKLNRYLIQANGIQMDTLGEILGIDRVVVDFVDNIYFGFNEDATALSFGDLNDSLIGGRFRSSDENPVITRRLIDSEFRALLLAKITKNSSNITPNDVLTITSQILSIMFSGENIPVNMDETGNASFEIQIEAMLSGSDQAFIADLDLIPRPAGVRVSYLYSAPSLSLLAENGLQIHTQDNLQLEIQ